MDVVGCVEHYKRRHGRCGRELRCVRCAHRACVRVRACGPLKLPFALGHKLALGQVEKKA
jgi:hypothetical protein